MTIDARSSLQDVHLAVLHSGSDISASLAERLVCLAVVGRNPLLQLCVPDEQMGFSHQAFVAQRIGNRIPFPLYPEGDDALGHLGASLLLALACPPPRLLARLSRGSV